MQCTDSGIACSLTVGLAYVPGHGETIAEATFGSQHLNVFILSIRGQLHSTFVYRFLQDRWFLSCFHVPFSYKVGIHVEDRTFKFSHV